MKDLYKIIIGCVIFCIIVVAVIIFRTYYKNNNVDTPDKTIPSVTLPPPPIQEDKVVVPVGPFSELPYKVSRGAPSGYGTTGMNKGWNDFRCPSNVYCIFYDEQTAHEQCLSDSKCIGYTWYIHKDGYPVYMLLNSLDFADSDKNINGPFTICKRNGY